MPWMCTICENHCYLAMDFEFVEPIECILPAIGKQKSPMWVHISPMQMAILYLKKTGIKVKVEQDNVGEGKQ
jgi:hypothetical protein